MRGRGNATPHFLTAAPRSDPRGRCLFSPDSPRVCASASVACAGMAIALRTRCECGRDAVNGSEVDALHQLGERARDLRDQLVGLALEVANAPTILPARPRQRDRRGAVGLHRGGRHAHGAHAARDPSRDDAPRPALDGAARRGRRLRRAEPLAGDRGADPRPEHQVRPREGREFGEPHTARSFVRGAQFTCSTERAV